MKMLNIDYTAFSYA